MSKRDSELEKWSFENTNLGNPEKRVASKRIQQLDHQNQSLAGGLSPAEVLEVRDPNPQRPEDACIKHSQDYLKCLHTNHEDTQSCQHIVDEYMQCKENFKKE
mmetsp:Transcript_5922/g.8783  ORF Transcript_5922/g.8783 Transcript_5922/m.8783 type:complete len:103 (+) Transcript_5922:2572-2880(+)